MVWYVVLEDCTCDGITKTEDIGGPYTVRADAYERAARADRDWPKDVCTGTIRVVARSA